MGFSSWLRNCTSNRSPGQRAQQRPTALPFRPRLEALEDRAVPSTGPTILSVTSRADSGKDTLRDAVLKANKHADRNYEIDILVTERILLESALPGLAGNVTIKGLGTGMTLIERDARAGPFRILTVDTGATAALSGLAMAQGDAGSGNGGAIDNRGNLTLTSCSLCSNSAANGGAIENESGASLTASATAFSGNQAGTGTTPGHGGAIDNDGTLTANGGFFTGNTAASGGAIATDGTAILGGDTFVTNHSTGTDFSSGGGAVWNNRSLTVQGNSSFAGNTAGHDGGAIDNFGTAAVSQSAFISSGTIPGNSAVNGGGAITNRAQANLEIGGGTSFVDSTAGIIGGAIENIGNITVTQAVFANNGAVIGGAIFNEFGAALTVNTSTGFTSNSASDSGGAIYSRGTVTVSGATFSSNRSTGNDPSSGGGAVWNNGSLTVQGNSLFVGNTAGRDGGAIDNLGTAAVSQTAFTSTGSIPGNSAGFGGAIFNGSGAALTLDAGTSLTGNVAVSLGGAIDNHGTVTMTQAAFAANSSAGGGAIFNDLGATLTLNVGTSFTSNFVTDSGGAIYNEGALSAAGATFTSNMAPNFGGALINFGGATVSGCSFTSNKCPSTGDQSYGGGAIENQGTLAVGDNSEFFFNSAGVNGGAILNIGTATATVAQTVFNHNSAFYGGAVANLSEADLTVNAGTIFTANVTSGGLSSEGGAILNHGTLTASGAAFTDNTSGFGGGVFNDGAATVTGCNFTSNKAADGGGGGICTTDGAMMVSGCQLTLNTASFGGGIEDFAGSLTVSNCDLQHNTADVIGGGIYVGGNGTTSVIGSYLVNNGPDDTHREPGSTLIVTDSIIGVET
jgi:predicted outer membrane repeat protein